MGSPLELKVPPMSTGVYRCVQAGPDVYAGTYKDGDRCYHKDLCYGHSAKHYFECPALRPGITGPQFSFALIALVAAGAYMIFGGRKN